ncbi:MAG: YigZ family protein [Clostridiaceae bacterium]|nr:YigZ family protein [Clostridiaceae bacterium]
MRRERWISLSQIAETRLTVKKSVFIAEAGPLASAEEARIRMDEIRKRYPDATHHVYAWRVSREEIMQKYSDDKEPSGTAGLPVLDVLRKNGIEDAIVVVTRYFGGTQLGTGGLARAYGEVAAEAVREAVPCVFAAAARYEIRVEFPLFERLKYVLEKEGFPVDRVMYRDCPVIQILCPKNSEDRLAQICSDHTSGRSTPVFVEDAEMIVERVGETRNE